MKASDFSTSEYLNAMTATPLKNRELSIHEVKAEMIREKRKMLIRFEGVEKMLVMNKTNRDILTEAYGDETDEWINKHVILDTMKVMFEGKLTPSITLTPVTEQHELIIDADKEQASHVPGSGKKGKK